MDLVAVVLLLVAATYAINILKIRMVVGARPVAAAALEGAQSFLYVYVLVRLVESANTGPGMAAYVVGAILGTLVATRVRAGSRPDVPGHYHSCCPRTGEARPLGAPEMVAAAAPASHRGHRDSGRVQRTRPSRSGAR